MKRLLNTLYVTAQDRYLSLDGENVVVKNQDEEIGRVPLHNLEAVVSFGYPGASPALMAPVPKEALTYPSFHPAAAFWPEFPGKSEETSR